MERAKLCNILSLDNILICDDLICLFSCFISEEVFSGYKASTIIPSAIKHPGNIVEAASLSVSSHRTLHSRWIFGTVGEWVVSVNLILNFNYRIH